jgi:hypothetical protein
VTQCPGQASLRVSTSFKFLALVPQTLRVALGASSSSPSVTDTELCSYPPPSPTHTPLSEFLLGCVHASKQQIKAQHQRLVLLKR